MCVSAYSVLFFRVVRRQRGRAGDRRQLDIPGSGSFLVLPIGCGLEDPATCVFRVPRSQAGSLLSGAVLKLSAGGGGIEASRGQILSH